MFLFYVIKLVVFGFRSADVVLLVQRLNQILMYDMEVIGSRSDCPTLPVRCPLLLSTEPGCVKIGLYTCDKVLFETTASALDSAQASLAPSVVLTIARAFRIHALGFIDERTEPQTESRAEAVVSKRAYDIVLFKYGTPKGATP